MGAILLLPRSTVVVHRLSINDLAHRATLASSSRMSRPSRVWDSVCLLPTVFLPWVLCEIRTSPGLCPRTHSHWQATPATRHRLSSLRAATTEAQPGKHVPTMLRCQISLPGFLQAE